MKILLINPRCRLPVSLPLGLGYIASVLRQKGYCVTILDINGFAYSDEKVVEVLKSSEFDIVGIGGLSSTYKYVKWLAASIKKLKPTVPIVAGNMVSTAHPELLLMNSEIDVAVIDEGEVTFEELVYAFEDGRDLKGVDGIFFKDKECVVKTRPRKRIADLDNLPFPAWDLFPMETYLNNSMQSAASFGLRSTNISSVRGCPYSCTFCSHPFGRTVYTRSGENIVSEIKELKKRYRVQFIDFSDDLFLFNEDRVMEFCDMTILENLNIRWSASGRVNLVKEKLLMKMRRAGCAELSYGFESGSQCILDKMGKHATVEQAEAAIEMTRRAGIRITGSFIFGMPGETKETIRETLEFIKRTQLPLYRFFYATPYPGTELYSAAKAMRRLPEDEDSYMESLGEMRTTFLVNLTNFSDGELVRLKNLAESDVKKNMNFKLKAELFIEDWLRRYVMVCQDIKKSGISSTLKMIILKIANKFVALGR